MANPDFCQKGWPVPAAQRFVLCPVGRAIAVAANEKRYDENARREGPLGYSMDFRKGRGGSLKPIRWLLGGLLIPEDGFPQLTSDFLPWAVDQQILPICQGTSAASSRLVYLSLFQALLNVQRVLKCSNVFDKSLIFNAIKTYPGHIKTYQDYFKSNHSYLVHPIFSCFFFPVLLQPTEITFTSKASRKNGTQAATRREV